MTIKVKYYLEEEESEFDSFSKILYYDNVVYLDC